MQDIDRHDDHSFREPASSKAACPLSSPSVLLSRVDLRKGKDTTQNIRYRHLPVVCRLSTSAASAGTHPCVEVVAGPGPAGSRPCISLSRRHQSSTYVRMLVVAAPAPVRTYADTLVWQWPCSLEIEHRR